MIIGFVQTKGGTGKSTLAMNTAFSKCYQQLFESIALVELDPQGTLRNWWRDREEAGLENGVVSFHHITSTQKEVFQEGIRSIAQHNGLMIMDIPGEGTGKLHTRFACAFADLVLIPMRASGNDEAAFSENLYPIIRDIIYAVPEKKGRFFVLPTFTHPNAKPERFEKYFRKILPPHVECLKAVYPARSVYENFNRGGLNLHEYAKYSRNTSRIYHQAVKAVKDIETIAETIYKTWEGIDGKKNR